MRSSRVRATPCSRTASWAICKLKVFCSENAHFSVQKNMALMGLGYQSVTQKPIAFARMDVNDLAEKLAQAKANGEQVMAIVATAGTTDAGAIDPLRDIARLAAEQQIWVHVDAARAARCCFPSSTATTRRLGTGGLHYPTSTSSSSRPSAAVPSC